MKQATQWRIVAGIVICLIAIVGSAPAEEIDDSNTSSEVQESNDSSTDLEDQQTTPADNNLKGEIGFRYDWIGVNKDEGRFREDNWMTDRSTGGVDWLRFESIRPDANGYEFLLQGRGLYDYDYDLSFLLKKRNSHYLQVDFSGQRRYFDGSNEYWIPSGVNLAELSDDDFFVDRRNYNVEFGLTPQEGPHWVVGWHRLEKDGREVLLHGRKADDDADFYGIPTILDLRGVTDTIYVEVFHTFAEKYNIRIRQEFEQYQSNRYQDWQAMNSAGVVDIGDGDISDDDLGYTNWRTMAMFDSFLDDQTYITANYMYNYLNSNSSYNDPLPVTDSHYYKTLDGTITRSTNVAALGYRKSNALWIPELDVSLGVRFENSWTEGSSRLLGNMPGSAILTTVSEQHEFRVAEALRLVYKGFERTTLSFDADLEQQFLDWDGDYTDSSSASSSLNNLDRKSETNFAEQVYTVKAVHRFCRAVKSTVKFRIQDFEQSIDNRFRGNVNPNDYPGWLGSYRRTGHDLTVKTDFRINSKTSATLTYQYIQESLNFNLGGETSDREIHRGMGNISCIPMENLFLVGTFMLESYDLDSAAVGTGIQAPGSRPYDFKGHSYSVLLDGTYSFNEKTSCTLGFQHTEALGTVDYAGDYAFDKVVLALKHKIADNQTIGLGYQFYNYNNHDGGDFDDYLAHGAFVTYSFTF